MDPFSSLNPFFRNSCALRRLHSDDASPVRGKILGILKHMLLTSECCSNEENDAVEEGCIGDTGRKQFHYFEHNMHICRVFVRLPVVVDSMAESVEDEAGPGFP